VAHQDLVDRDPVPRREDLAQPRLGGVGRLRAHPAETVADAVHVGVDANPGKAETERDHQVGGLAADAGQLEERIEVGRCPSSVALDQDPGDRQDLLRLASVEPDRKHRRGDLGRVQAQHGGRGSRQPEQALGRGERDLVPGAQ